ncbi:hypothetical protein INR49_015576 [Caranx melampygus]|nr:hypothetical protein INR49_015576 [Caranx melampygus]
MQSKPCRPARRCCCRSTLTDRPLLSERPYIIRMTLTSPRSIRSTMLANSVMSSESDMVTADDGDADGEDDEDGCTVQAAYVCQYRVYSTCAGSEKPILLEFASCWRENPALVSSVPTVPSPSFPLSLHHPSAATSRLTEPFVSA